MSLTALRLDKDSPVDVLVKLAGDRTPGFDGGEAKAREETERLREQSQELVDWFFGARDPSWLPEHLLYEEVEEVVEELIPIREEEEYEYVEPSETYYEE